LRHGFDRRQTVRYSPGHKEQARARLIAAAGRGFRKRGYGGIGVDGLAKEAEVTSGAFYGHFPSKEAAFKEAVVAGIRDLKAEVVACRAAGGTRWVADFADFYLGVRRTCDLGDSCALQSLTPEVQRAEADVKAAFEAEASEVARAVADGLGGGNHAERLDRAWALLALLSGGVTLARAVGNPAIADGMAAGLRRAALGIAGSPASAAAPSS
jgi:TetR/AcrR family transcriptional regulator, transcriptional repressor for nem operon